MSTSLPRACARSTTQHRRPSLCTCRPTPPLPTRKGGVDALFMNEPSRLVLVPLLMHMPPFPATSRPGGWRRCPPRACATPPGVGAPHARATLPRSAPPRPRAVPLVHVPPRPTPPSRALMPCRAPRRGARLEEVVVKHGGRARVRKNVGVADR
eukprot:364464-Chlamydomonas_euryale.AAC.7